jgi:hypothetical protein
VYLVYDHKLLRNHSFPFFRQTFFSASGKLEKKGTLTVWGKHAVVHLYTTGRVCLSARWGFFYFRFQVSNCFVRRRHTNWATQLALFSMFQTFASGRLLGLHFFLNFYAKQNSSCVYIHQLTLDGTVNFAIRFLYSVVEKYERTWTRSLSVLKSLKATGISPSK